MGRHAPRVVRGLDRTDRGHSKNEYELASIRPETSKTCVICVGSTGSGKSSTIGKFTLKRGLDSDGFERKTSRCALYEDQFMWIDTVGWGDRGLEDEELFQDAIRFIENNGISHIKAVIWNVIPNQRKDATVIKQAQFIDKLQPREIWDRVIIVCKQSMNPERDGLGAIKTAEEFNPDVKVRVIGYRFYEDPSFNDEQREKFADPETRRLFNVRTNEEIRGILQATIESCPGSLQFSLKEARCMDCGETGDPRLMSLYCHMESHHVHQGSVLLVHPTPAENYHESDYHIIEHDGVLRKLWFGRLVGKRGRRYTCCGHKPDNPGCQIKWSCCKEPVVEVELTTSGRQSGCKKRYPCCGMDPEKAVVGCDQRQQCCGKKQFERGCAELCKKCGKAWGTPAERCYRKEHNVTYNLSHDDSIDIRKKALEEGKQMLKTVFGLPPIVTMKPF